jgi:hypothetical protein
MSKALLIHYLAALPGGPRGPVKSGLAIGFIARAGETWLGNAESDRLA